MDQVLNETHEQEFHYKSDYDRGDIAWMMSCSSIVFLMIPGVGYFYNGMAKSKSSLSLIILCFWSISLITIQWYLFGYSLTFSREGSFLIGNFDHVFLYDVLDKPSIGNPRIPALLFSVYQSLFASICPTIILGACAERTRFLPTAIFIFLWSTFVYDFLAYWSWNPNGWTYKLGAIDFGGGTPIHISTGGAALAFAYVVGKRENYKIESKPHNMSNVVLGTSFIWFGWLIANAGSGLASNLRAVMVFCVTNMSACAGGITWTLLDYRHEQKYSALGFCCGAIAGLVAITPASGFVSPTYSLVFGVLGAVACNFSLKLKHIIHCDDAYDVFSCHGVGGLVGNLLTGIFAQKSMAALDGTVIAGGWVDGHWAQLGYQAIDSVASLAWAFAVTYIILFIMNKIPGLELRAAIEDEENGLDEAELGVSCYEHVEDIRHLHLQSNNHKVAKRILKDQEETEGL